MSQHLQIPYQHTLKFITQDSYMGINIWTWLIAHPPHVDINLIFNTPRKQKTKFSICKFQKIYIQQKRDFKKNWFLDFSFFSSIRRTLLKTLNLYYCEWSNITKLSPYPYKYNSIIDNLTHNTHCKIYLHLGGGRY